jgi:hypothetical protein
MLHLIGKEIQFTSKIEDMEAYPEGGMRAQIKDIKTQDLHRTDLHDHIYIIEFDYSKYDEYNKQFESANYYAGINTRVADKTAREVGQYQVQEKIYFGSPVLWPFEEYFTILNEKSQRLFAEFKATGETNYVEWLESKVE